MLLMRIQVIKKILYSSSSDHTARAWLKDIGELLQVYKGNKMPVSRVVYQKGIGQCLDSSVIMYTIGLCTPWPRA